MLKIDVSHKIPGEQLTECSATRPLFATGGCGFEATSSTCGKFPVEEIKGHIDIANRIPCQHIVSTDCTMDIHSLGLPRSGQVAEVHIE